MMFPLQNSACPNFGKDRDSMRKQGLRSNWAALKGAGHGPGLGLPGLQGPIARDNQVIEKTNLQDLKAASELSGQ